jgi:4-amino-4-deoxy-L-arabinose transferase-like glycosyltransferase
MNQKGLSEKHIAWGVAALVVLYLLSVLVNLGMMELEGEEPRRAVVSIEMMYSGKYLNPTLFGWPYLNKPPVFNWLLIASMKLLHSTSEAALRLPSLVIYVLWAAVHYRFSRRFFPKYLALLSAFMQLTCVDIYFYGLANGAEIDIFYSFIVYLQAIAIFHFYGKKQWLFLYLFSYLFCAMGFLTKGFPSIVFQGLTLIALCIYARSVKPLFRWQHLAGGLLFFIITGLYFWGYNVGGNAQNLLVNFLNESLMKSAIGERSNKVWEKALGYPVLVLKLLAPWSLLLLVLAVKTVRQQVWQNPLVRFSIFFIACNLWVYWFTGQPKARYIYMFVPFAATIFVQLYHSYFAGRQQQLLRYLGWAGWLFVLAAAALVVLPFLTDAGGVGGFASAVLLVAFCWQYFRNRSGFKLWLFIGGIMLLRLVYAVVFIPIQDRGTAHYEAPMQQAVAALKDQPLHYWVPVQPFPVAIDTKIFTWRGDTISVPPLIHPQVPYYYHKHSGKLLLYDSVRVSGRSYISFDRDLEGGPVDSIFSFGDKRGGERMVVYRFQ